MGLTQRDYDDLHGMLTAQAQAMVDELVAAGAPVSHVHPHVTDDAEPRAVIDGEGWAQRLGDGGWLYRAGWSATVAHNDISADSAAAVVGAFRRNGAWPWLEA